MNVEHSLPVIALAPSRFALLLASVMTVSMAYGVTLPFLPFILERVLQPGQSGAVPWHTGLLTALYTLALFLLSPLWGLLSDRFNRSIVISFGLIGSGASLVLLDNVSSLTMLYASRMLSGIFAAAVIPATLAYVAETCTAADRARKFAIVASFTSLGFMLGPLIGGWLSSMVLLPPAGMRLAGMLMPDSPFFVIALVSILCASGMVLLSMPHHQPRLDMIEEVTRTEKRRVHLALLLTLITVFGVSTAEVGITLLGKQSLSLDPRAISQFFVVCSLVMITVQIGFFPLLMRRFSIQTLLVSAFVLAAFGLGMIPYTQSIPMLDVLFGMIAAGTGILVPVLASVISDAAGQGQGKALGQQTSAANLGQAIAAAATGALFFTAPAVPFLMSAAMLAVGAWLVMRAKRGSNSMNKSELIAALATKADLSKAAAGRALDVLVSEIVITVAKGDSVALVGFGTFKSAARAAREGKNPRTGEKLKIKATTVPKFSADATFKQAVASKGKAKKK